MALGGRLKSWFFYGYVIGLHLLVAGLVVGLLRGRVERPVEVQEVAPILVVDPEHTPEPESTPCTPEVAISPEPLASVTPDLGANRSIIIPVAGVNANQLVDTF